MRQTRQRAVVEAEHRNLLRDSALRRGSDTSITPSAQRSLNAKICAGQLCDSSIARCSGGTLAFGQAARTGQLGSCSRSERPDGSRGVVRRRPALDRRRDTRIRRCPRPSRWSMPSDRARDVVTAHGIDATNPPRHGHDGHPAASSVELRVPASPDRSAPGPRIGRRRASAARGVRRGAA